MAYWLQTTDYVFFVCDGLNIEIPEHYTVALRL